MRRDIEHILEAWKTDDRRRPLLIRGARQVGKSFTVMDFGKRTFDTVLEINFEQSPQYKACFSTLDPQTILDSLAVLSKTEITSGHTLLFLDEVQDCPQAIQALRYFYEQLPEFHVIAAGSLVEFTLAAENFRMPVGRVQYLYMKPLSFGEFLDALGEHLARKRIEELPHKKLTEPIHQHVIGLLRKYMILGGMPAVVDEYVATSNLGKSLQIQAAIVQTYRDDFGKYASTAKHPHLQKVFNTVPKMVGEKFKYSKVDSHIQSRELKAALELLEQAGLLYRVKQTSGSGVPLEANVRDRHFKVIFLDIGLMQHLCGLTEDIQFAENLMVVHAGSLSEQLVGQELLATIDPHLTPALYYWAREAKNSNAEVDYLITQGSEVIPVEVKSGKTGTLRSMHLFLEQYGGTWGIKCALQPYGKETPVVSVPLYAVGVLRKREIFENE